MGKQTGWVIAATEGATVDGRTITKQWIEDMAAQYSVDEYTAMIWPEHFRSSWGPFEGKNWGIVDEVKASTKDGKLRLYVKLTANDYLLAANQEGQKLFMSIEPNIDYKGTGKAYLSGIAVTDSPASTGTTRLKFSAGDNHHDHEYSQLEELQQSDFITEQATPTEQGLFAMLRNYFNKPNAATDPTEEDPMKTEQFEALMGKFETFDTKLTELETKVDTFGKKPEATGTEKTEIDTTTATDKTDAPGVSAEQFSKVETLLTGLTEKLGAMETKFNALSKETAGQEPDPAGLGESYSVV
ncbi:GPO family capsid scaffolding protein [Shewanella sp. SR44-4]|uniref:GPO family capsid scaffolding protein n=1 Tax=Shewanella sp. SR44-4 TaxID=2760935 RepID=UPI001604A18B|nr:GPO family capsid scaffolding protein [Shewanella sp. SR44-4]MBB1362118.1 GPO family capsid scaffolding protein [Shewanella sp. SR44-4]